MNDLIERIVNETGITPQQAQQTITTIANYIKEKFPMIGGAVDNLFPTSTNTE